MSEHVRVPGLFSTHIRSGTCPETSPCRQTIRRCFRVCTRSLRFVRASQYDVSTGLSRFNPLSSPTTYLPLRVFAPPHSRFFLVVECSCIASFLLLFPS